MARLRINSDHIEHYATLEKCVGLRQLFILSLFHIRAIHCKNCDARLVKTSAGSCARKQVQ